MAQTVHTCTGCVPIDASIIDTYLALIDIDKKSRAAETEREAAEAERERSFSESQSAMEQDHALAVADHSRAESDHTIVEGYSGRLSNVERAVGDISTGKYYGYYSSAENLPHNDTIPGFAYVGTGPYYTIYNFDGSGWSSSGVSVDQSPIGNDGDINQDENGKLQFANRIYNPQDPQGMGFKILRSESAISTQVSDEHTIYEIRDIYDLHGTTLNIPDGSVLRFNGGMITNGTLNLGENVLISAEDVKIFDGVTFTGNGTNQYFRIDWFVANYANSVADTEPDATSEIQAMFNSGIKKVWLTNKHHYRLTSTVTIDASIIVDGDFQTSQYRRTDFFIFGSFDAPLIRIHPSSLQYGVSVRNIYLKRIVAANSLTQDNGYKESIPTLLVDCTDAAIWGLYIKAVLHANQVTASYAVANGSMKSSSGGVGYTGIEINSVKYCYYTRIEGEIRNFYRGVYAHQSSSGNYTGGEYLFDSNCAKGGELVGNAKIGGLHELCKVFPSNNSVGYFYTNDDVLITGYIWDTSYTHSYDAAKLESAYYSVKAKSFKSGPGMQNDIASVNGNERYLKYNQKLRLMGNADLASNLLPQAFYNQYIGGYNVGGIKNIVFRAFETDQDFEDYIGGDTTKGIPVNKDNTFGYDYLFFPDKLYYDNISGSPNSSNYALKTYVKNISTKVLYFECTTTYLQRATLVVFQYSSQIDSIVINRGGTDYTYPGSGLQYFQPIYMSLSGNSSEKVSVTINYTSAVTSCDIPYIGICGPGSASQIGPWGGSAYGIVRLNKLQYMGLDGKKWVTHPSFRQYKTDNTGSWIPVLHYKVAVNSAVAETTLIVNGGKNRIRTWSTYGAIVYGDIIKNGTDFLVYKMSTNNYVICAKNFYNLHIESVECNIASDFNIVEDLDTVDLTSYSTYSMFYAVQKSGATADRPDVPSGSIGVPYFDTTLGKMIWHNGSGWVDATGTSV